MGIFIHGFNLFNLPDFNIFFRGEGDTNRLGLKIKKNSHERHKVTNCWSIYVFIFYKHVPTLVPGMEGSNITKLSLTRGNEAAKTGKISYYMFYFLISFI